MGGEEEEEKGWRGGVREAKEGDLLHKFRGIDAPYLGLTVVNRQSFFLLFGITQTTLDGLLYLYLVANFMYRSST